MAIAMNIVFGFVTLWVVTSRTESRHLDAEKVDYSPPPPISNQSEIGKTSPNDNGKVSALSVFTSAASTSSVSPFGTNSSTLKPSPLSPVALNAEEIKQLDQILKQGTTTSAFVKATQATEQTTVANIATRPTSLNSVNISSTESISTNDTSRSTTSVPKVISTNDTSRSTTSVPKVISSNETTKTYIDFFKHSFSWLGNTYTLSIVLPVLAGFLFAIVIIITLAMFSCIRRRCRRRRIRRKILPETIRKMGPSDRAKLLAETSDEEF